MRGPGGPRASWWAGVGALALVALVIGLVVPKMGGPAAPMAKASVAAVPPSGVMLPSSGRSVPTLVQRVPVYYAGRSNGLLYREFRNLAPTGNIAETALTAMLNVAPLDPDFTSWWAPVSGVRVDQVDNTVIVSLPASAFARAENPTQGRVAIEQLVYTVTAAIGDSEDKLSVQVLMDGQSSLPANFPAATSWKRDGLRPLAPLWITSPTNGASVAGGTTEIAIQTKGDAGPVTVTVTSTTTNERIGSWSASSLGASGGWHLWQLEVGLIPDTYDLRATGPDGATENVSLKVSG